MFSSISRLWSSDGSDSRYSASDPLNDLPVAQPFDLEKEADKRTRTLRHLVKLNHATFALVNEGGHGLNTVPDILAVAFDLGCSTQKLDDYYEEATLGGLTKWQDSPTEVTKLDWVDFLGQPQYQRAFLDFFEDELVEMGYHWRELTMRYLYYGDRPLVEGFTSMHGKPLTRLAFGLSFSSRELAMEGLAMLATCWPKIPSTALGAGNSEVLTIRVSENPLEILLDVARSREDIRTKHPLGDIVQAFGASWALNSISHATKQAQITAAVLVHHFPPTSGIIVKEEFADLLILTHSLRTVLPGAPLRHAKSALLGWWRETLHAYLRADCPEIRMEHVVNPDNDTRTWETLKQEAIGAYSRTDSTPLQVIHSLLSAADAWSNEDVFIKIARVTMSH